MRQYQGMRSPPVFWPYLRFAYAVCLVASGRLDVAMPILDEALAMTAGTAGEIVMIGLRGDVLAAMGQIEGAETAYAFARDASAAAGARMVQLEAEARLVHLHDVIGRPDDGAALRAVYDTFTEGFGTVDLLTAKALLDARA